VPADSGGLLVFDPDCGFCTRSARWLDRRANTRHRFAVVGWRDTNLDLLGLTRAECLAAVQFMAPDGAITSGHRAIASALSLGGGAWPLVGYIGSRCWLNWPLSRLYAFVARHRHQLPGGTAACEMR